MKLNWLTGDSSDGILEFKCPGCKTVHPFHVPKWEWNGSMEKPTFKPSLLVHPSKIQTRCHSVITDGMIAFQDDCDHELKNQTVEIPEWDESKSRWEQYETPRT